MNKNKKWLMAVVMIVVIAFAAVSYSYVNEAVMNVIKPAAVETKTDVQDTAAAEPKTDAQADAQAAAAEEAAVQEPAAEEEQQVYELSGEVTEVTDAYFVIVDAVLGEVQVNVGDDTLYEGIEAGELAAGQFAQVIYDGKLTRSLPAQAYALRVGVYAVTGEVKETGEGSVTLIREEIGDEVIVFLPEGAPEMTVGAKITAYTNGAMTMSLPAQTNAIGVVIH